METRHTLRASLVCKSQQINEVSKLLAGWQRQAVSPLDFHDFMGLPDTVAYVQQEHAKAALASRCRGHALLEASDKEDEAATALAPTTMAIPKATKLKQIQNFKVRSRPMPAKTSAGHAR